MILQFLLHLSAILLFVIFMNCNSVKTDSLQKKNICPRTCHRIGLEHNLHSHKGT